MKTNLTSSFGSFFVRTCCAAALCAVPTATLADVALTSGATTHYKIVWDPTGTRLFTTGFNGADLDIFVTPGGGGPSALFMGGAGSQVVYDVNAAGDVLYTSPVAGASQLAIRRVVGGTLVIPGPAANDGCAQFSSDGSFIIYTERALPLGSPVRLYRFDLPAGPRMALATTLLGDHLAPVLSPDNATVAFLHSDSPSVPLEVWTVASSGMAAPHRVTDGTDSHSDPAWSNDSSALAVIRGPEAGPFELVRIDDPNGAGTASVLTLLDGTPGDPTWSRDDTRLFFTHALSAPPSVEVWDVPSSGGTADSVVTSGFGEIARLPTVRPTAGPETVLTYQRYGPGAGPQIWTHEAIACLSCADSNCDGSVGVSDIGFFVRALTGGQAAWQAAFPGGVAPCDFLCANDVNGDSLVTVSDIGGFVVVLTGGACPA